MIGISTATIDETDTIKTTRSMIKTGRISTKRINITARTRRRGTRSQQSTGRTNERGRGKKREIGRKIGEDR